jgi:hypothetical protein
MVKIGDIEYTHYEHDTGRLARQVGTVTDKNGTYIEYAIFMGKEGDCAGLAYSVKYGFENFVRL